MKAVIFAFVSAAAFAVFSGESGTYNDLGGYSGQNTAFWDTTGHDSPTVNTAEFSFTGNVETRSAISEEGEFAELDTRVRDTAEDGFPAVFDSCPFGSVLVIR